ncbi:MAG TPA: hypothetical protein VI488_21360 [Candidatus Angelobacter sp.]
MRIPSPALNKSSRINTNLDQGRGLKEVQLLYDVTEAPAMTVRPESYRLSSSSLLIRRSLTGIPASLAIAGILFGSLTCTGEQSRTPPAADAPAVTQAAAQTGKTTLTIPAGTQIFLALVRSFPAKSSKPGDGIYLETIFPVLVNGKLMIPAGTFLQGSFQSFTHPKKPKGSTAVQLQSAQMIFANGYTLSLAGTTQPDSGAASALVLMIRANDDVVVAGTTVDLTLTQPVSLEANSVADATAKQTPLRAMFLPPNPPATCYTPGSPGTPDTVIPGSPGTPDTVIPGGPDMPDITIPGTPATPDRVIPGTPATPSTSYPCPR